MLIFKSSFADCTEHNYQTVGYRDAVCMKDGYKGDRVCMNCGQYDPNDVPTEEKVIPAAKTEHEGVLLPLFYDKNDKTPTTRTVRAANGIISKPAPVPQQDLKSINAMYVIL